MTLRITARLGLVFHGTRSSGGCSGESPYQLSPRHVLVTEPAPSQTKGSFMTSSPTAPTPSFVTTSDSTRSVNSPFERQLPFQPLGIYMYIICIYVYLYRCISIYKYDIIELQCFVVLCVSAYSDFFFYAHLYMVNIQIYFLDNMSELYLIVLWIEV